MDVFTPRRSIVDALGKSWTTEGVNASLLIRGSLADKQERHALFLEFTSRLEAVDELQNSGGENGLVLLLVAFVSKRSMRNRNFCGVEVLHAHRKFSGARGMAANSNELHSILSE